MAFLFTPPCPEQAPRPEDADVVPSLQITAAAWALSDAAESSVIRPTTALSINFRVTSTGASLVLSVSDNDATCNHSPTAKEHMRACLHQHYKLTIVWRVLFKLYEEGAFLDRRAACRIDAPDRPRRGGAKLVLHLHGLHHDYSLPRFDSVTDAHVDAHDQAGHGRHDRSRTGRSGICRREVTDGSSSLVERFDLEPIAVHPERV